MRGDTYSDATTAQGTKDEEDNASSKVQLELPAQEARDEAAEVHGGAHPEQEHDGLVVPLGEVGVTLLGQLARDGVGLNPELLVHETLVVAEGAQEAALGGGAQVLGDLVAAGLGGIVAAADLLFLEALGIHLLGGCLAVSSRLSSLSA